MYRYVLKRILFMIPVLIAVSFVIFTILYLTPGDPAKTILGEQAMEKDVENLRREMGLDKPFLAQYANYLYKMVVKGDIGTSYHSKRPVIQELLARFPTTILLAVLSLAVAVIIGIPTGIISATKQYSAFDNTAMVIALFGVSMPNFWQGMMGILVFSVWLNILPVSGFYTPAHWVLPMLTIGTSTAAIITRMTRSSMLEVIRQDYIRTARAKGQKESVIIFRHELKNALIPIITVIGLQFGYLLGGAVLTESIFSVPGIGKYMVDSIKTRDYPVIQGGVLLIAATFIIINLIVDILYAYADPRIKANYKQSKRKTPHAKEQ